MKRSTLSRKLLIPALLLGASVVHAQGVISTISGNGVAGFSGDGGAAISAQFNNPSGVAVNDVGDIYIADKNNSRVRKISGSTGVISTFAGTGVFGLSGLGGPAINMSMRMPDAVSVKPDGDILIADWYNDMVFEINHITFDNDDDDNNGDGDQGDDDDCLSFMGRLKIPSGACADIEGRKYISDNGNNRIRIVVPTLTASGMANYIHTLANTSGAYGYSGDGGPAAAATFQHVTGVAFDNATNRDLYISDQGNNVIRKIDMITGIITTVVGTGVAGYSGDGGTALGAKISNPGTLFVDHARNLYICDRGNNVIRKVNLITGIISTVAGNGTMGFSGDGGISTSAQLNGPEGVWVDNAGYMYIADMGNQRIRKVDPPTVFTPGPVVIGGIGSGTVVVGTPGPVRHTFTPGTMSGYAGKFAPSVSSTSTEETTVFPNPSAGVFTVQSPSLDNAVLEVYNVLGAKVYTATVNGSQNTIDLGNQPSGVYTMSLHSSSGVYTQKLTVAK